MASIPYASNDATHELRAELHECFNRLTRRIDEICGDAAKLVAARTYTIYVYARPYKQSSSVDLFAFVVDYCNTDRLSVASLIGRGFTQEIAIVTFSDANGDVVARFTAYLQSERTAYMFHVRTRGEALVRQ